jgi:AbrB family looped-hinge helix DNA binding protein
MDVHYAKMTEGGRLLVPAELRRILGIQPGSDVVLDLADGELRVRPLDRAVARAQAIVRRYVPDVTNVTDEFIRERRAAAASE